MPSPVLLSWPAFVFDRTRMEINAATATTGNVALAKV